MLLQGRLRGILSFLYIVVTVLAGTGMEEAKLGVTLGFVYWVLSAAIYLLATRGKDMAKLQYFSVALDVGILVFLAYILDIVMGPEIPFAFLLKTDLYPATILFLLFHMISINTRIVLLSGVLLFVLNLAVLIIAIMVGQTTSDFSTGFTSYRVNPEFEAGKLVIFAFLILITWYISRRNRRMIYDAANAEVKRNALGRYFSPGVLDVISETDGDEIRTTGNIQKAAILFSDIKGFTSLSENIAPDEVVKMLREYHEVMVEQIFRYGGTLDKFIGDAIMASFGVPVSTEKDAMNAVLAALDMEKSLARLNERRKQRGDFPIHHRIGIHYGEVVAGNIGSKDRLEYTVIGDTVNTASRIESANKKVGTTLLISDAVYEALDDKLDFKAVGTVKVKGKSLPVRIFTPMASGV